MAAIDLDFHSIRDTHDPRPASAEDIEVAVAFDHGEVMDEVDRIVSSLAFGHSERRQKFLRFIVEQALAGRAEQLSEYTIAAAVFGRDQSFDPKTSSIVRVEAGRLRAKLDSFYATESHAADLEIKLATGGYVPTIQRRGGGSDHTAKPWWARLGTWAGGAMRPTNGIVANLALAVSLAALALLVVVRDGSGEAPAAQAADSAVVRSVAVLPLRNLSGDLDQDRFSDALTGALTTGFAKSGLFRVVSMTSAMAYKNVHKPIAEIGSALGVTHVLEGSVLRIDDRIRITVQLIDARADRHIWSESYARDVTDALAIQADMVERVVGSIATAVAATDLAAANP